MLRVLGSDAVFLYERVLHSFENIILLFYDLMLFEESHLYLIIIVMTK